MSVSKWFCFDEIAGDNFPGNFIFPLFIVTIDTIKVSIDNGVMNQSSNVEDSLEPMTVDAITVSGLTTQVVGEVIMHLIRHIDINQFKTCRHTELTLFLEYRDDPPRVIASGDIGYKHRVVRRLYAGKEK